MKKTLSMVLALAMAASATALPVTGALADAASTEEASFTVLAKTWSPYNPDETSIWDELAKRTGIRMNFIWAPNSNYDEKVNTILASDDLPDAIYGASTSLLLNQEAIIPLDDLLAEYCPNYLALLDESDYAYLRNAEDGQMYFISHILDFPPSYSNLVREDWVKAAGIESLETWDDWMNYWTWVRDNDANGNGDKNDEIPIVVPNTASLLELGTWFDIKVNNSFFATTNDGELVPLYEHEHFRDYLENMIKLYNDGLLDKEFATRGDTFKTTLDSSIAGTTYYFSERANLTTATLRSNGEADAAFKFAKPVRYYEGTNGLVKARTKMYTYGLCITTAAEERGNVENILNLFNYIYSDEGSLLMNYGLEGVHHHMEDGKYVLNDDILAGGFTAARASGIIPSLISYNFLGDAYMQILTGGKTYEELDEPVKYFYDALYENEPYFYTLVPMFDTASYIEYGAEYTSKLTSIFAQCVVGELSIDDFYAQYESIKASGWQDVIDEQIEAYNSIFSK